MTAGFDLFAPGSAQAAVLVGARVSGLIAVAPVFSATTVPKMVKAGMIVVLTVLLQPAALGAIHGVPRLTPGALAGEALIGLGIGFGAALLIAAVEMVGDAAAVQIGLSGAAILDPLEPTQLPTLGVFTRLFGVALLLAFNMHHVMLQAVADSLQALPPGSPINAMGGLAAMVSMASRVFVFGVRFAAPVIAVALITNIAMAVLGRAATQLNLLSISFPVQIAVGLFALAASLPSIAHTLAGWTGIYGGMLDNIGGGFAAVPR